MNGKHIIIFHGGKGSVCLDGTCAAAVVNKYLGPDAKSIFVSAAYGDGFDVGKVDKETTVWIVDFSFPIPVMHAFDAAAKEVFWFDHHETTQMKALGEKFFNTHAFLDTKRSGCTHVWDILFEGMPRPMIVNLIEDRDLWRFNYPETRPVTEALYYQSKDPTDEQWNKLLLFSEFFPDELAKLKEMGEILLASKSVRIERAIKRGYYGTILGKKAFYVNAADDISEIGETIYLSHSEPIVAVIYSYDGPDRIRFSLRSNTIEVNKIAERFGGGGHVYASGFELDDKRAFFRKSLKDRPEAQI